jgi:flagellar biosynthesis protein FlhG
VQLGLMPERDVGEVISGRMPLEGAVLHHAGGFDILPGRSGSGSLAALDPGMLERVLAALREATARYDVVIADLGAGLDRAQRRMASFSDLLLVIATDEPASLTDAYAVLKLHASDAGAKAADARIVVNQAGTVVAGERTFVALRRACSTFLGRAPTLAGVIRRDDRVREAIRRQSLLLTRHPTTQAAADVEAIASGLVA